MMKPEFYRPTERGLEARIREHLERLRQLDTESKRKKP
jgi:replication-associated recombination protein RarA